MLQKVTYICNSQLSEGAMNTEGAFSPATLGNEVIVQSCS